jgi:hypothetical protein
MKSSERLLLSLFLIVLLAGGGVVLWTLYRERRDAFTAEKQSLELSLVEVDALLEDESLWTDRATLLSTRQPRFTTREEIDNAIFEDARSGDDAGVVTTDVQLIEPVQTEHYAQAGVSLKAEGTVEDVFRWLHRLQSPETFRVVRSFKANPHPDENEKIVCEIELLRWYAR